MPDNDLPRRPSREEYIRRGMDPDKATLRACGMCDPDGFRYGPGRVPTNERCDHGVKPAPPSEPVVDVSEPRRSPNAPSLED